MQNAPLDRERSTRNRSRLQHAVATGAGFAVTAIAGLFGDSRRIQMFIADADTVRLRTKFLHPMRDVVRLPLSVLDRIFYSFIGDSMSLNRL